MVLIPATRALLMSCWIRCYHTAAAPLRCARPFCPAPPLPPPSQLWCIGRMTGTAAPYHTRRAFVRRAALPFVPRCTFAHTHFTFAAFYAPLQNLPPAFSVSLLHIYYLLFVGCRLVANVHSVFIFDCSLLTISCIRCSLFVCWWIWDEPSVLLLVLFVAPRARRAPHTFAAHTHTRTAPTAHTATCRTCAPPRFRHCRTAHHTVAILRACRAHTARAHTWFCRTTYPHVMG